VGCIFYLTTTKPNISFVVGIIFRFMQNPCKVQWFVAKRVLKYLKGTQYFGLRYSKVDDFNLIRYSDTDFVGDKKNGVSNSSYLMSLGLKNVSWRSCKQSVLSNCTTKEEYVVVVEESKEILWFKKILEDLQEKQVNYTPLLVDNTYAIKLSKNPRFHDRNKNINTKYHMI
jgi:hypothetical protein